MIPEDQEEARHLQILDCSDTYTLQSLFILIGSESEQGSAAL